MEAIAVIITQTVGGSPFLFMAPITTFVPKTLRSMIEEQAQWTEDDLRRLRLIN